MLICNRIKSSQTYGSAVICILLGCLPDGDVHCLPFLLSVLRFYWGQILIYDDSTKFFNVRSEYVLLGQENQVCTIHRAVNRNSGDSLLNWPP